MQEPTTEQPSALTDVEQSDHEAPTSSLDAWVEANGDALCEDDRALFESPVREKALGDIALVAIGLARAEDLKRAESLALAILNEGEQRRWAVSAIPTEKLAAVALFLCGHHRLVAGVALREKILAAFKHSATPFPREPTSYFFALQLICSHREPIGIDLAGFSAFDALGHPEGRQLPRAYETSGIRAPAFEAMVREGNGLFSNIDVNSYSPPSGDDELWKFTGGAVTFIVIALIWIFRFLDS